jgi:large subunit ribosomal protein L3
MNGLLAKKLGMTQLFLENGTRIPVTVLQAGPCEVVQVKTKEVDGYESVQIGFGEIKEKNVTNPLLGHFKKAGVAPKRFLAEFSAESGEEVTVGKVVDISIFEGVTQVSVSGITKGHGFAGTIKRYSFASGPRSHGSKNVREPGSNGASTYPARTFPGKRMPGQFGNVQVTVRNLNLVKVDSENGLLYVKGAVPGPKNGLIKVRKA